MNTDSFMQDMSECFDEYKNDVVHKQSLDLNLVENLCRILE